MTDGVEKLSNELEARMFYIKFKLTVITESLFLLDFKATDNI
ncbi:hypothetical protein [Vibrio gallaecicus]|nr:hypothetical protein [Vibrio gallaecicus]MDN3612930.1 hypothetical protein [Vibrio gallaecicus]